MAFKGWEKVAIRTAQGEAVEAVAPVIVSASRRTDIPAFYPEWLVRHLHAGYVKWVNPFSRTPQYVSFGKTRAVVFWTKNPRPLMPFLSALNDLEIGYYLQFTVNDYETEELEPGVPPLAERIETFRELSQAIGNSKVVWRYDPLLLTDELNLDGLVERVARIGDQIHTCTEKLVIAFADIERYAKVQKRLRVLGKGCRELLPGEMREFAERLVAATRSWGIAIATCAETIDLTDLGIDHNRCIDDELLARLFGHDPELMRFLGPEEFRHRLKDTGQRKACGCIVSKDIGVYDTCPHLCRYCYASSSERAVREAAIRHRPAGESLA